MNYKEADAKLQGRCYSSRKLENNTYLQRRGDSIAVRLHSTDVITFNKDGSIEICTGGWHTITTVSRINGYLPSPWRVGRERNVTFLYRVGGEPYWSKKLAAIDNQCEITRRGKVTGGDVQRYINEWKEADKETRRQAYWIRKAAGLKIDSSECTHKRVSWSKKERCRCWQRRNHRTVGTCVTCRCKISRVQSKSKLTVDAILQESNVTVRMAMAHVYGLERFLVDAKAQTLDTQGEYALLDMPMGTWQHIKALKMTCPSTGAVYISPVDPSVNNVPDALDWYFQTKDYLSQVTQQS